MMPNPQPTQRPTIPWSFSGKPRILRQFEYSRVWCVAIGRAHFDNNPGAHGADSHPRTAAGILYLVAGFA
jgi:hypothetical protein